MTNPAASDLRAEKMRPVNGDAGDAIDYALGHIADPDEQSDFLDNWRAGTVDHWPDYARWLEVQYRHRPNQRTTSGEANGLADEIEAMANGLRVSMWAKRDDIISLLDRASASLRAQPDHPADVVEASVQELHETRCSLCHTSAPDHFGKTCNRPECPHRPAASDLRAEKMREALEFYADASNWGIYRISHVPVKDRRFTHATDDRGERARAALQGESKALSQTDSAQESDK